MQTRMIFDKKDIDIFSKGQQLDNLTTKLTSTTYCLYSARQIFLSLLLKFFSCKNLAFVNLPTNR